MSAVRSTGKVVRRIALTVVGTIVLVLGIIMIVAPGPAFILIPLGLAILGLEFAWARSWLKTLRRKISHRGSKERAARSDQHRERSLDL